MEDLTIARSARADRQGRHAAFIAWACALTLAVLLALALAGPASAAVRDFRVGVTDGAVDPPTDVRAMGTANVETLRIMFNWRRAEPAGTQAGTCPGQYDWTATDPLVREASDQNVRLLPVILGSPGYVSADPRNAPDTGRAEIGNYKCFVRALVARYGRGGNLPANPNTDVQPIEDWQVWNEPNLDQYSVNGARPRPREYARLLRITSKRIRTVDPAATIVMAGLPETPSEGLGAREFLTRFYRRPGVRQTFDVLALHPYALNYRGVKGAVQRLRQFLGSVGDRGRYMWITEIGWATHGQPGPRSFLEKSDRGQARQLRKTFTMLRNNRQRYNIGTSIWFRWRDFESESANAGPFNYTGLFRRNGNPKQSCDSFVGFTGGVCTPIAGAAASAAGSTILAPRSAPPEALPSPPAD